MEEQTEGNAYGDGLLGRESADAGSLCTRMRFRQPQMSALPRDLFVIGGLRIYQQRCCRLEVHTMASL